MLKSRSKKFILRIAFVVVVIGSLTVAAAMGIFVLLFGGEFEGAEARVLFTTLVTGLHGLAGLCCSLLLGQTCPLRRAASVGGLAVTAVSFVYAVVFIWLWAENAEIEWRILAALLILTGSAVQTCLLVLATPKTELIRYLFLATVGLIAGVAVSAATLILIYPDLDSRTGELIARIIGAAAILDVLGTIALPIINRFYAAARGAA